MVVFFMKFCLNVTPLEATPTAYILIS